MNAFESFVCLNRSKSWCVSAVQNYNTHTSNLSLCVFPPLYFLPVQRIGSVNCGRFRELDLQLPFYSVFNWTMKMLHTNLCCQEKDIWREKGVVFGLWNFISPMEAEEKWQQSQLLWHYGKNQQTASCHFPPSSLRIINLSNWNCCKRSVIVLLQQPCKRVRPSNTLHVLFCPSVPVCSSTNYLPWKVQERQPFAWIPRLWLAR